MLRYSKLNVNNKNHEKRNFFAKSRKINKIKYEKSSKYGIFYIKKPPKWWFEMWIKQKNPPKRKKR